MYWAWEQGRNGKNFRETRDKAADAGTLAHAMIEADIKGRPFPDSIPYTLEILNKARLAYENYLEWKRQVNFELKDMEKPYVSEKMQYGTTIDINAEVVSRNSIVEVKTSKSLHEDYLIQVAAQKFAHDENNPDNPIEGLHLLKLGTENATFTHVWLAADVIMKAWPAFVHLRGLHDLKKVLKGLI